MGESSLLRCVVELVSLVYPSLATGEEGKLSRDSKSKDAPRDCPWLPSTVASVPS
jgi:hypothetical protein